MNSNNQLFALLNIDSQSKMSSDSGHFTPRTYSSGRCTPNSQISSCYDVSSLYGHSSNDEALSFFYEKDADLLDSKLFRQYSLNAQSNGFDSLPPPDFDRGCMGKLVSYAGGSYNKNNHQSYNQSNNKDEKRFFKHGNGNRNRRPFNKENEEINKTFKEHVSYEYKNYKENDVSKLFRLFRFLHHLITFEEGIDCTTDIKCKFFTIGLSYPNTMHINTHMKYACEISSIVYKSLESRLSYAKMHLPFFQGSKFFMMNYEEHIYAAQEFCNMAIEHKNNVILLIGGKEKLQKLFLILECLIEDVKEARAIYHMFNYYFKRSVQ